MKNKELLKVLLLKDKVKVKQFYNKNQYLIFTEQATILQSYDAIVAVKLGCTIYVAEYYINYSKTTSKHLYMFLRECGYGVHNLADLQAYIKANKILTF